MSSVCENRKFSKCLNKNAHMLRGNRAADQRLCFRYITSTISVLSKSKISSLLPSPVSVQPGLCRKPRRLIERDEAHFVTDRRTNMQCSKMQKKDWGYCVRYSTKPNVTSLFFVAILTRFFFIFSYPNHRHVFNILNRFTQYLPYSSQYVTDWQ